MTSVSHFVKNKKSLLGLVKASQIQHYSGYKDTSTYERLLKNVGNKHDKFTFKSHFANLNHLFKRINENGVEIILLSEIVFVTDMIDFKALYDILFVPIHVQPHSTACLVHIARLEARLIVSSLRTPLLSLSSPSSSSRVRRIIRQKLKKVLNVKMGRFNNDYNFKCCQVN